MISPNPKSSYRLFQWYCDPAFVEDISGDLTEIMEMRQQKYGYHRACWLLLLDVLLLFRPEIIRSSKFNILFVPMNMYVNYFRLASRTLIKNKLYALINIMSLGIAMCVVTLIAVYVSFDLSFDRSFPEKENIYRPTVDIIDSEWAWSKTFPGLGPLLKDNYAEIEDFTRVYMTQDPGIVVTPYQNVNDKFIEEKAYYVDGNIFEFFDLELKSGNPDHLLDAPQQLMLSSELAQKYYGRSDYSELLGREISITDELNQEKLFKITGVFQKIPNSHFRPDLLMSIHSLPQHRYEGLDNFEWPYAYTYLRLSKQANVQYLKQELDSLCFANAWNQNFKFDNELQALSDIHHLSVYDDEMESGGSLKVAYFLIAVAIFIMICAWVNYINMAVAKSIKRAKEVGVRKTLGAHKTHLISQFLLEGFLVNFAGGLLSILLISICWQILKNNDLFNGLSSPWQLWYAGKPSLILFISLVLGLIMLGTIMSSTYPSLVLSSYHPAKVLKGLVIRNTRGMGLRQGLLTSQFVISALLIIGIFAAKSQLTYMLNKDLGFEKEQKLIVAATFNDVNTLDNYMNRARMFKQKLKEIPSITDITSSCSVPGKPPMGERVLTRSNDVSKFGGLETYNNGPSTGIIVGANFLDFYDLKLKAGTWFPIRVFEDSSMINKYMLVNEKFATVNGFDPPESIIGETIWGQYKPDIEREPIEVIGLVENYHHFSVKQDYIPLVFTPEGATKFRRDTGFRTPHNGSMRYFSLKTQLGDLPAENAPVLISKIENLWQDYFPELAFEYYFLDDAFNHQYKADIQLSQLFAAFGSLSIFISCLGLFGLSSYLIQQRTKEIGIRKVLGASLKSLFTLLSASYMRLVLLASVISIPFAWWTIRQWLESYVFRIEVEWWFFALPLLTLIFISLATISFKILKTSTSNPVDALRYE